MSNIAIYFYFFLLCYIMIIANKKGGVKMIGDKIKRLRKDFEVTQKHLAREIGVSQQSISHFESGHREPPVDTLKKIASFFNVSIDYLVYETYSKKRKIIEKHYKKIAAGVINNNSLDYISKRLKPLIKSEYLKGLYDILSEQKIGLKTKLHEYIIKLPFKKRIKIVSALIDDVNYIKIDERSLGLELYFSDIKKRVKISLNIKKNYPKLFYQLHKIWDFVEKDRDNIYIFEQVANNKSLQKLITVIDSENLSPSKIDKLVEIAKII